MAENSVIARPPAVATHVLIEQLQPSPTQSGKHGAGLWRIRFLPRSRLHPEPLMGWISSNDTRRGMCLTFDTEERAIAWAKQRRWSYTVVKASGRRVQPKSYAANFHPHRKQSWTH